MKRRSFFGALAALLITPLLARGEAPPLSIPGVVIDDTKVQFERQFRGMVAEQVAVDVDRVLVFGEPPFHPQCRCIVLNGKRIGSVIQGPEHRGDLGEIKTGGCRQLWIGEGCNDES